PHCRIQDVLSLRCGRLFLFGADSAQTSRLATQLAKVIKLGASHFAGPHHLNLVDHGRVQGKDSLHAGAEGHLPDRKAGVIAGATKADYGTFEYLDSFLFAFLNLNVDRKSTRLNSS